MRRHLLGLCLCIAGCSPSLEFSLPDLDGNSVSPLSHGNVVVLAFWATWCKPCQLELAEMNEMYLRLHPRGLELYAISVDGPDSTDDVESWAQAHHYAFPVLLDSGGRLFGRYNPSGSIPYLLVFDANGEHLETRRGYHPRGVEHLEAFLSARLGPGPAGAQSPSSPGAPK